MKLQPRSLRVKRLLTRTLRSRCYRWDAVSDPRGRRGRRWKLTELLNAVLAGQLSGCPTLRDVESLTEELGPTGQRYVSARVPDTTLWDLLCRLDESELRTTLQAQVRTAWRAKSLSPVGLPCGAISFDGKGLGALEHDADGTAQKNYRSHDGSPYWLSRVLRAVLVSAEGRPCLDQRAIAAKSSEISEFGPFFSGLCAAYGGGDLFEIVLTDAGMTSLQNATLVNDEGKAYVMALKAPQQTLFGEARRLLGRKQLAEAETDWELHRGWRVKRRLFRTVELAGYGEWKHLRQLWRVEQLAVHPADGTSVHQDRYFVTNLPAGRLTGPQILTLVRGHWRIENDCYWTLDTQWREDSVPWCSKGRSALLLSWFRLMAYNILQLARRRHLRRKREDGTREPAPAWRQVFNWVRQAWQLPLDEPVARLALG